MRRLWWLLLALPLSVGLYVFSNESARAWARSKGVGQRTVAEVVAAYGPRVATKYKAIAADRQVEWPPKSITLLTFKKEKRLEVWAKNMNGDNRQLASYQILASSGTVGPKRKEGDRQVPEGFYKWPSLNPNSRYHLSIKVDYPNSEDIANRTVPKNKMGGDIFIHGDQVSIGCIAIGNAGIEEVFCLAAWADKREIIISPVDFRATATATSKDPWVNSLYRRLKKALDSYR
jgi:murein L,D-transpeptidase YafK